MTPQAVLRRLLCLTASVAALLWSAAWLPAGSSTWLPVGSSARVLAQEPCIDDAEPNDTPAWSDPAQGAICIRGSLPPGDQDLVAWEVPSSDPPVRWTFSLTGVQDAVTSLSLHQVLSEPGVEPLELSDPALLTLSSDQFVREAPMRPDVLLAPGRYVLAVYRSEPGGLVPDPALDYEVRVVPGAPWPTAVETEPDDDPDSAVAVTGAFEMGGDRADTPDVVRWQVPDDGAGGLWSVTLQVPLGTDASMVVSTADGERSVQLTTVDGMAVAHDLAPDPAGYLVTIDPAFDLPAAYVLSAAPEPPVQAADAEPDDLPEWAHPLDPERRVGTGRLATRGDVDAWRLTVDDTLASQLLDVRLVSTPGPSRVLCLLGPDGTQVQCRSGVDGVTLRGLRLAAGDHILTVGGEADPAGNYLLRVDAVGEPRSDHETEPNDTTDLATPFDAGTVMHGRSVDGDRDVFLLRTEGEPQLWRIDLEGAAIQTLAWWRADGGVLATGEVADDGRTATLYDLYLVPGEHRIVVEAGESDYTLRATPLGPPDPDAEREPNDDESSAERMELGDRRIGKLRRNDTDRYRLSLSAQEHLSIDLQVAADALVELELSTGSQAILLTRSQAMGAPIHYEALLPAGAYQVRLVGIEPSQDPYTLRIDRLDPFVTTGDLEPDDAPGSARSLPSSGIVEGDATGAGDPDMYRLDPWSGGPFTVDVTGDVSSVELLQDYDIVSLIPDPDGGTTWRTDDLPAGSWVLSVTPGGPYTIEVPTQATTAGPDPAMDISMVLSLATDEVAGWWPEGQQVQGTLTITTTSTEDVPVDLSTWTSQAAWSITAPDVVEVPAGGSVEVPVVLTIPAEAWAGSVTAVAIHAVAQGDAGAAASAVGVAPSGPGVTALAEVAVRRDAAPVDPRRTWSLPDTLLGGLDVAWTALGGLPDPFVDPDGGAALQDGDAIATGGLAIPVTDPPTPVTITLGGTDPVPVAGFVLNPISSADQLAQKPREVRLSLSTDGVTFEPVLSVELTPLGVDQAFVLDAPRPARYAQLEILSTWSSSLLGDVPTDAILAEWKVIATPGSDPADGPRDIADPASGGHVVWTDPQLAELPDALESMLTEDREPVSVMPSAGGTISWVIGFHHDRAAQVTSIEWSDPDGSDPSSRTDRVQLDVSVDSPLGPWRSLGTWELERADDGSIAPFVLDEPVWARFIRFRTRDADAGADPAPWELPGTIRVFERSTDDTYRSILAEWGGMSRDAIHEVLEPTATSGVVDDPDVGEGVDAAPLEPDTVARGQVVFGADVDEYLVRVPEGHHSIRVTVAGEPFVAARVDVLDETGMPVATSFGPAAESGAIEYRASVTPGATYRLRVEQPPFSVAFLYDTSLSIAEYWPAITGALDTFVAGVQQGRDDVLITPFGSEVSLLPDWSDRSDELRSAVEGALPVGDSSAEWSILRALERLEGRDGARAILLITDGETSSFQDGAAMWQALAAVRPLVFPIQLGGSLRSSRMMQDWAAASGGAYRYAQTQPDLDLAFDQLATWLRRPAVYALGYTSSEEELAPPEPGTLRVVTPTGDDGQPTTVPIDPSVAIELVLDTSGSMLERLGDQRRIDAAKDVLTTLVRSDLPPGTPVALRWFRQRERSCDTELGVPLGPLDPDAMAERIGSVKVLRSVKTPLAAAIASVADDLADATGPRVVVIVSDGQESCGGDPAAAIRSLRRQGFDVTVNIVGLGLSGDDRRRIRRLAELGGGTYFDARTAGQLREALASAVGAPFDVLDAADEVVAHGTINGPALELAPGDYRIVVRTDPEIVLEARVRSGEGSEVPLSLETTTDAGDASAP